MNISIKLDSPVEFINITPMNPLISKCEIKVCWVGDTNNRNKTIITKDVAIEMANSLPGSPIVGFFNEATGDFEEHNRIIDISNGKFEIKDTTRPYGFVDLNAKVWFQKFSDNGVEHEYLMTEGYLWTGQYPECQRVIDLGNNQSMELDEELTKGVWTKDENGKPQFFIINEAIFSKLCILGEDCEPCFEGATITAPTIQFSFDEGFKQSMYSMMKELKELLNEGGVKKVFTTYAVEIGDSLWSAVWDYLAKAYPADDCYSIYKIEGIYEEEGNKFIIVQERENLKYFRINFVYNDEVGFQASEELIEVVQEFVPSNQFAEEDVEAFAATYTRTEEEIEVEVEEEIETEVEENVEEPVINITETEEYIELANNYSALEERYNTLLATNEQLEAEVTGLRTFKLNAERETKKAMIANFYMLSDDDKKDVIDNIDSYSLEDIESKLSVICYRNKVNFSLQDNTDDVTTVDVNSVDVSDNIPDWIKAVRSVAKTME